MFTAASFLGAFTWLHQDGMALPLTFLMSTESSRDCGLLIPKCANEPPWSPGRSPKISENPRQSAGVHSCRPLRGRPSQYAAGRYLDAQIGMPGDAVRRCVRSVQNPSLIEGQR